MVMLKWLGKERCELGISGWGRGDAPKGGIEAREGCGMTFLRIFAGVKQNGQYGEN